MMIIIPFLGPSLISFFPVVDDAQAATRIRTLLVLGGVLLFAFSSYQQVSSDSSRRKKGEVYLH